MLLDFTFENCFSYRNETYISLEAAKGTKIKNEFEKIQGHRVLKSAIIFGPNASGKSNVLKAFTTFRELIIPKDLEKKPYPTFAGNSEQINFQITIMSKNTVYKYSVFYNQEEIIREKLEIENQNEFIVYFDRYKDKYQVVPQELKVFTSKTRKDNLFLNTAKTFNDEHCLNVYRWFRNELFVSSKIDESRITLDMLYKKQHEKNFKDNFLNFLKAADFNIIDFEIVKTDISDNFIKFLRSIEEPFQPYQMILRHKSETDDIFALTLDAESEGTRKFINLAIILLSKKDSTILIDEFDNSFHLALSKALVLLFNSEANSNQFILTSHELNLLDAGFKKEQVYFTDKYNSGSELYSIYDFKSEENRNDYSYFGRYKKGMFGSVPEILVGKMEASIRGK